MPDVDGVPRPTASERAAGTVVIDAHTHIFPDEVVRDRTPFLRADAWFGELYASEKAAVIGADELLRAMDAAGVDGAVACGWPWRDAGLCRLHNDALAGAAATAGGRLAWLAIVSPADPAAAAREAERAFGMGAAGIGELNADAQGFALDDPRVLAPLVDVCLAHDRPALFHASEPVGHAYPGKGTAVPAKLVRMLAAHPGWRVTLAHWGGGLPFHELMPEIAEVAARVVYDSAASTYLFRPQVFRAVLDIVGPERVLWGSDHPVLGMGRFLRRTLADGNLRPEEVAPVLGGNAARWYGFVPPAGVRQGQGRG